MPHNHNMWAAIGVYQGREDNILFAHLPLEIKESLDLKKPLHPEKSGLQKEAI